MTHDRPHGGTDTLFEDLERELSSEPSRGGRPEADSDPLAELVAGLVQRGELSTSSARRIIDLGAQLRAQSAG